MQWRVARASRFRAKNAVRFRDYLCGVWTLESTRAVGVNVRVDLPRVQPKGSVARPSTTRGGREERSRKVCAARAREGSSPYWVVLTRGQGGGKGTALTLWETTPYIWNKS